MTISKDDLLKRKEEIVTGYNELVAEIEKGESQIKSMRNNLNAMSGALQQTEMFIAQIEEDGDPMPEDKAFALDMATSQEITMSNNRITEEKEESNSMIHETLTTNPNDLDIENTYVDVSDEEYEQVLAYRASLKKEKEENEKL